MSSMQLSLAVIGGIILIGVVIFNAIQTRRSAARNRLVQPSKEEGNPENPLGISGEPQIGTHARLDGLDLDLGPDVGLNKEMPINLPLADTLIDSVATLSWDAPIPSETIMAALPPTRRVGGKALTVAAQNLRTALWELPTSGQRYQAIQVGVQLANRGGSLNEIEFSEFLVKAQQLADTLSAQIDPPDMMTDVARARELDNFASSHDAQLGVVVRAVRSSWSAGFVMQQATQLGFMMGPVPGQMILPSRVMTQVVVVRLSFDRSAAMSETDEQSVVTQVDLSLDVTQVPKQERAFERLCNSARELAHRLEGQIVDDVGHPINDETLSQIGLDLERLYEALETHDLAAGSPLARRLFS